VDCMISFVSICLPSGYQSVGGEEQSSAQLHDRNGAFDVKDGRWTIYSRRQQCGTTYRSSHGEYSHFALYLFAYVQGAAFLYNDIALTV
jgi:hypothetical protein